jgi:hypothetical protein
MFRFFKKSVPEKFVGHVLDPMKGYYTTEIVPSSEADGKRLAEIADGDKIYILVYYEQGERVENLVHASKKNVWLNLKNSQYS